MIWLAVAVCCLVSFVFSGIEAGILSVNRVRLKHRVKLRDRAALVLDRLLKRPERLLVTVLLVTNLMNIFALAFTTRELVVRFGASGYFLTLAITLPVYLLGLELLPKSLFRRFPYRALAFLATPLRIADLLLSPLHFAGQGVMRMISGKRPIEQQKLFVAREEFKYLTIESERTGALGKVERQMIHNVVDFRAVTAAQVMIPMDKVRAVPATASVQELLRLGQAENIERWPVLDGASSISGLVQIFDVAIDGRKTGVVDSYQRRIVQVAPEDPAYSIVRKLRAARTTLAVVNAPDGKPLGIVTWEDLIKRLVSTAVA
ncbi:MAG TPA: CNNM domain-containing protein [Chthoniobacteraceae bacterium]